MKKKKISYERKVRNSGLREPRPIVYIVGEGKRNKTEALYFESFKSNKYCVKFVQESYSNPQGIVKKLRKKLNDKNDIKFNCDRDMAYCLIDTDCNPSKNREIQLALIEARKDKKTPIIILTSNPCFEIWFILHERYTEKQYNKSLEVLDDLKKLNAGFEDYEKSDVDTYKKTIAYVGNAITNAKRLEEKHIKDGLKPQTVEFMPSTEIYRIVELLLQNG